MRISTNMKNNSVISSLMTNETKIAKLQTQLESGNKVNSASDDPSAVSNIMDSASMLKKIEVYEKNISLLEGEASVTDSTLSQMTDYVQRLKTLTVEAANGTNSSDQLKMINAEVEQIKEQIVSLGNTQYQGSYIFAGNKTGTIPFVINDDGSISYNGTPSTDDYKRSYSIADGVTIDMNFAGDSLLGYSNLVSAGPPPEYDGEGLLNSVNQLTVLLDSDDPDFDAIRSKIDEFEAAQSTVVDATGKIGGVESRLEMTNEQHENNKITYTAIKADLQEVDVAQVVSELSAQEVALQASLYASSEIASISLLDYL